MFKEYGLYAHPRWSSAWINYNFSISLDDLWKDITYSQDEIFIQYGLHGLMESEYLLLRRASGLLQATTNPSSTVAFGILSHIR